MSYNIGNKQRGRPQILLKKREIEYAISITQSMREAAMYCKVSYNTFKNIAKQYKLWDPNPGGRVGQHRMKPSNELFHKILKGGTPSSYRETTMLKKLFREGHMEMKCTNCSADFTHFIDPRVPPLVLDFLDGDNKNGKLDNLRVLCLNCIYELRHYKHKAWYRHRNVPIVNFIDNELEPQITVAEPAVEEVEFIPFEEFQKTLEN